ncbi:hypothetical protein [Desulfuromonas thiophila]|uniref:hypothetical protein n=1 Tax=Desulfuromonas thiophila TaxID=57664 RepID=UPI0029F5C1E4|nr:hypothetical protein [Desulfuromonas thiophila]
MWAPAMRKDEVRQSDLFYIAGHRGIKGKSKSKTKVKVAGIRPGRRHPFDLPLKRMQKPAELLLTLDQPTLWLFP